jgi:hypothetical protein
MAPFPLKASPNYDKKSYASSYKEILQNTTTIFLSCLSLILLFVGLNRTPRTRLLRLIKTQNGAHSAPQPTPISI